MMLSNYALERSVTPLSERAAGARKIVAPAARRPGCARPAQRGRWASLTNVMPIRSLIALAVLAIPVPALSTQFHGGPTVEARHTFLLMHEGEQLPFAVEAKLTADHHALAEMVVYAPWGPINVPEKAFVGIPDPDP